MYGSSGRVPGADDEAVRHRRDRVDYGVALGAALDDEAPGAGAALAGGDEGALDDDGRRGRRVARVPDDQRIVAAELEREDHLGAVGEAAAEDVAGGGRAGEQQGVDVLVEQCGAGLPPALDEVDDPGRHAGGLQRLDHQSAGPGRLLRWLVDDGVAGQQSGDDVAVRQMPGKVVGPEHGGDAVRLVAEHGAAKSGVGRARAGPLAPGADRDVHLGGHRAELGPGFPERLARFAADRLGVGGGAGEQLSLVAEQDPEAGLLVRGGPALEGGARRRRRPWPRRAPKRS
jgi:hypothetical protein